jgi:hypothetical protein
MSSSASGSETHDRSINSQKAMEIFTANQQRLTELFQKLTPLFVALGNALDAVSPYVERGVNGAQRVWTQLAPYHPEELLEAVFGIFLCFFGGHYVVTLAAIEAYKLCGWDTTYKYLCIIREDYLAVRAESRKDDSIDADKDGVADVLQITKQELFTRKLKLAAKSCNPDKLQLAFGGLYTGFMGVVATLRVRFAQTITLGAVIGGTFSQYATKVLQPVLIRVVPLEYAKWVPVAIDLGCRAIGISIAWFVQRVISAFYSAIRGANIAAKGILSYLTRHGHIAGPYDEGSFAFVAVMAVIGGLGFLWQITNFMDLPFPFNVVFFPLSIVEWLLQYFVGWN